MSARKRARTDFAAPTEDDNNPSSAVGDPSSSALSTRRPRYTSVPPLTVLCSRVFANNYVALRNREKLWARVSELLRDMPDSLRPLLLADLKRVCPTYLKSEFIVAYFFHGHTLTLSDLPGLTNQSIRSLDRMKDLRELELSGFGKVPDNIFAGALRHMAKLRRLVLRGCSLVGPKTMGAIVSQELRVLNLNYTTVTPSSLQPLLLACSANIEALKLASIPNWTDTTFRKLLTPNLSLPRLHT
ncbi:hypothetical protein MKEN_00773800 [Mycena kentingensis (nom. inval.)]|nr:hypothetical protein MKEN_00773800 [Mycena kentingensis (nom. inval.)]